MFSSSGATALPPEPPHFLRTHRTSSGPTLLPAEPPLPPPATSSEAAVTCNKGVNALPGIPFRALYRCRPKHPAHTRSGDRDLQRLKPARRPLSPTRGSA
jgi:hypothetical protein